MVRDTITKILFLILAVIAIIISVAGNKEHSGDCRTNEMMSEYDVQGDFKYEEMVVQQDEDITEVENADVLDVILEVNVTSEIAAFRNAKIHKSENKQTFVKTNFDYYDNVCSKIKNETNEWRDNRMSEMITRLLITDITLEEYVVACYTAVALAATVGKSEYFNSPKLESVSLNAIMNFDYLYMKCTSIWLKFSVIRLTKERYIRLHNRCMKLEYQIDEVHGEGNVRRLKWDWEADRGINTGKMEQWVKESCVSLDKQRKTTMQYDDQKWWEANSMVDLRSDTATLKESLLSAKFVGCKHVDYMLIMGKVLVLDRRMLVIFGCRRCVEKEIMKEKEIDQERIWIIL